MNITILDTYEQCCARIAEELAALRPLVERWCALFGGDAEALMGGPFTVVTPDSKNPYRQMYAAN